MMDDMDMDMSMDSPGMFTPVNLYRAKVLWIVIGTYVGILTLLRLSRAFQSWSRRRSTRTIPSKSKSIVATITATIRELSYPQPIYFTGRVSKYFTPPSTGRIILLLCYWLVILTLLWTDVLLQPNDYMYPYRWEKVGFRAAWISISQIPFIYLLSCKFNPISLLTGISYERFNWLHRWAARTVFLTVIVHWSFFFREWWLADFVEFEFEMMPMVKYGFGAWAVMGWMILSGFGFFRALSYEFFVLQHICAAAFLLWLLYVHIPGYAMYNIWLSVGFIVFDWSIRLVMGVCRNTHLAKKAPGYSAKIEALSGDMVRLSVEDIDFTWKAGQHVYLWMPSLRPFELHPFTIADATEFQLLIKSRKGFSRSLHTSAQRHDRRRVFFSGSFGIPPVVSHYDTVLLIACSSGASFTTPILQNLIRSRGCVRQVIMHWMVREDEHFEWFSEALSQTIEAARKIGLPLKITVHTTRYTLPQSQSDQKEAVISEEALSTSSSSLKSGDEKQPFLSWSGPPQELIRIQGRPIMENLIRPAVESAFGETAIICCGGLAITAEIRTFVAILSDERAVHKGTGAQGIYLFTESYGW